MNAMVMTRKEFPDEKVWEAIDEYLEGKSNGYHRVWVDWAYEDGTSEPDDWSFIIGKALKDKGYADDTIVLVDNTW